LEQHNLIWYSIEKHSIKMKTITEHRALEVEKKNSSSLSISTKQVNSSTDASYEKVAIIENDDESLHTVRKSPRKNRRNRTARAQTREAKANSSPQAQNTNIFSDVMKAVITPPTDTFDASDNEENEQPVRRILIMPESTDSVDVSQPGLVEASSSSETEDENNSEKESKSEKAMPSNDEQKGPFQSMTKVAKNVRKVYTIVNKMSGSLGGNGAGGAIYGELTIGSMQKMINLMKEHQNFNENSRFIDVGCGLGKPNMHVAQDPCVEFSYGIEMEKVRWLLGMHNLNHVLKESKKGNNDIGHRCIFEHGNIIQAKTFDPFTHVYMFDIGFPPTLFHQLAKMFNSSKCNYLVCYHGPKLMIDRYGFDVELIIQTNTSMHGSSEGHMGYLYKRIKMKKESKRVKCDDLFADAWSQTKLGVNSLSSFVEEKVNDEMGSSIARRTRSSTRRRT